LTYIEKRRRIVRIPSKEVRHVLESQRQLRRDVLVRLDLSVHVETGEPVRFQGMFHPAGSNLTIAEATRSRINAFGIEYEGKTGLSTSEFSWAA
jgi:hypothetical protein